MSADSHRHRVRRRYGAAEVIADELRAEILRGEIRDGDLLPKIDELTSRFSTGKITVREALRILETEGLLSVQRGNIGGAIAHLPTSGNVAYTLSLVFEARAVPLADVVETIERLEPACAESCADRPDRMATVVPLLVDAQARLADCISRSDQRGAGLAANSWHDALVNECGNHAMAITVGALQAIWSAHMHSLAAEAAAQGEKMSDAAMRRTYVEHAEVQKLIVQGDGRGAADLLRAHMHTAQPGAAVVTYSSPSADESAVHLARTRARLSQ